MTIPPSPMDVKIPKNKKNVLLQYNGVSLSQPMKLMDPYMKYNNRLDASLSAQKSTVFNHFNFNFSVRKHYARSDKLIHIHPFLSKKDKQKYIVHEMGLNFWPTVPLLCDAQLVDQEDGIESLGNPVQHAVNQKDKEVADTWQSTRPTKKKLYYSIFAFVWEFSYTFCAT